MAKQKPHLYFHQPTGNICYATKAQARKLSDDWHKVDFVENQEGERVMRFGFVDDRGITITVDVQPNGEQEVASDGDGSPE